MDRSESALLIVAKFWLQAHREGIDGKAHAQDVKMFSFSTKRKAQIEISGYLPINIS